jgi:NADH-ubiquinone oxidoreductase chain 4
MILAGVLLKLGGYGLLCVLPVLGKLVFVFNIIWTVLSLVDGLFITLFCIWHCLL